MLVLRSGVILRGAEPRKKIVRAFAQIRQRADMCGNIDEAIGKNLRIDEHRSAGSTQFVDSLEKHGARLRLEWCLCVFHRLSNLFRRGVGAYTLERRRVAVKDEGRNGEALAFERSGLEILRVWAGL